MDIDIIIKEIAENPEWKDIQAMVAEIISNIIILEATKIISVQNKNPYDIQQALKELAEKIEEKGVKTKFTLGQIYLIAKGAYFRSIKNGK